MLTAEQEAIRKTGIGASELPAIAGLSPYETPLDVWLRKGTPTRPAIDDREPEDPTELPPSFVGSVLEPAILELYSKATGRKVLRPQLTYRHSDPSRPYVLASPDGVCVDDDRLAEIKCVGVYMLKHWSDGIPDYVRVQTHQQMAVMHMPVADVVMHSGTRVEIDECVFDPDLWESLLAIEDEFWNGYVLTDIAPPPAADEGRKEYLSKLFRGGAGLVEVQDGDASVVEEMLDQYVKTKEALKVAKQFADNAECNLRELIGNNEGIFGRFGRVMWATRQGQVSYKSLLEEVSPHGVIPAHVIEKHRGKPFRVFNFYPPKKGN